MATAKNNFLEAQRRVLDRYGVEAESWFIEIPSLGGTAHALVSGKGPTVGMLNGIGTPAAMWAPLMAQLDGFRLIAIDLPAYGLTDPSESLVDDFRHSAVSFLDEVLGGFGLESLSIVANSLGSRLSTWLALDRPERVTAMVHVGCPAVVFDTSAPLKMRLLSVKPLGRLLTWLNPPSESQVEELSKMVGEYPLSPEVADLLLATERLPGFRQTFLSTLNVLIRLRGNRPEMRLSAEQLERIAQPTLVFWGKNDPFGSVQVGKRMVKRMTNAELHVVDGGHAPWLTQSERIGPIAVRFLRQCG